MTVSPNRGEIWLADLNPIRGHEQTGRRPVLIVLTDAFNHGPADLVFVLPLTRTDRGIPIHVPVNPPEGGVTAASFILCDGLRSISTDRLTSKPWGSVTDKTMKRVEAVLRLLLEI